jgi:hypothetical protein
MAAADDDNPAGSSRHPREAMALKYSRVWARYAAGAAQIIS